MFHANHCHPMILLAPTNHPLRYFGLSLSLSLPSRSLNAGVLDCTWSPAWSEFRDTFRANAEQGFPHSEDQGGP